MQQFIAVLFVLMALWGVVLFLRRKGLAGLNITSRVQKRAASIRQLDKIRLTPQHSIHVLEIEDCRVILAVHNQGVTVLDKAPGRTDYTAQGGAITR